MKHRILIRRDKGVRPFLFYKKILRRVVCCALQSEAVGISCEINVLLTDNEGIRSINRQMRKTDKPTDVLSFPMYDFKPGAFDAGYEMTDPKTGLLPLGDMVLSFEKIRSQAKEYGHSFKREMAYLAVHSVLHLLGYDHMDEDGDKRIMRSREEAIMKKLGIPG